MKAIFFLLAIALLPVVSAQAGSMEIIKQRAKELNNQNNVRQGIGGPAGTAQPIAPASQPGQPLPPDPVSKIKADIAGFLESSAVTTGQKQHFTRDLLAAARGSHKPTTATISQLSESFAAALSGKTLGVSEQGRLAANLNLALNSASLSAERTEEIATDVQAILQVAGATRGAAMAASAHLRTVTAELQSASGK